MQFDLQQLNFIGDGLVRPECVLATQTGNIYVSDFMGGISQIKNDGSTHFFGGGEIDGIGKLKPNGICMLPSGNFLAAHLGDEVGGVYQITRAGDISPYLTEIDGTTLPPSNFIYLDHQGRLWLTVSTTDIPRASAYRADVANGFIAVIDQHGARIVADKLGYTNEVYVSPDGNTLYVNATFARQTLAFDINPADNSLQNKRCIARYSKGIYPDGLTMDTQGQLWVTSIVSNSVLRVNPHTGTSKLMLQDVDTQHLDWVEQAYTENKMGRPHLDGVKSQCLQNISSLAFGGENLDTLYLGCLLGNSIAFLDVNGHKQNLRGQSPAHWHFDTE